MKEDLIHFIAQTVRDNYEKHHRSTNGAQLAECIRAQFPEKPITAAGFEKLADAVREASDRGLVVRNPMVKHLDVLPPDVSLQQAESGKHVESAAAHRSQYVRPDAWRAFAMQFEGQSVYYNQRERTFEVRSHATNDSNLLEVSTPAKEDFRSWIQDFAQLEGIDVPESILQSDHCLREFSLWTGKQNGSTTAKWKKFRAARVVQSIADWGKESGIDPSDFFTPVASQAQRDISGSVPSSLVDNDIKSAVIACIRDMSSAEVESLAIPLRHVLKHFRPRQ